MARTGMAVIDNQDVPSRGIVLVWPKPANTAVYRETTRAQGRGLGEEAGGKWYGDRPGAGTRPGMRHCKEGR
jgi:hypothetical protein